MVSGAKLKKGVCVFVCCREKEEGLPVLEKAVTLLGRRTDCLGAWLFL